MYNNISIYSTKKKTNTPYFLRTSLTSSKIKQCIFLYLPNLKVLQKLRLELQVMFENNDNLLYCFSQALLVACLVVSIT